MTAGQQGHSSATGTPVRAPQRIDLTQLAAVLAAGDEIDYALVFGSGRDGVVAAGSDLDLAVALRQVDAPSVDRLLALAGRIEAAFGVVCDWTVLNTASAVLRHEALQGRVLFIRPGCERAFSDFYVRTCAEYEDLMAWRARQLAYRGYACPATGS